jgi:hypothetical protein
MDPRRLYPIWIQCRGEPVKATLDRGYETLVEKLGAAGAEVERFRE